MHVFLHWLLKSEVVWKNISNSGRHRLHHICYNHQSKLDFRLMCLSCCSSTFKVAICFESCSSAQRSAHSEPPLHSFKAWLWLHDWKRGQMLKYLKNKTTDLKMRREENYHPTVEFTLCFMEHFSIFKLIVLVFRTAHCSILSLFWPQVSW